MTRELRASRLPASSVRTLGPTASHRLARLGPHRNANHAAASGNAEHDACCPRQVSIDDAAEVFVRAAGGRGGQLEFGEFRSAERDAVLVAGRPRLGRDSRTHARTSPRLTRDEGMF
eukprot:3234432-Rhodomonas_salina.1